MSMTIDSIVRWWVRERPEQVALSESGDDVTYQELDGWVGRVATDLVDAGVEIGDRVCIYAANSLEWCVTALATLRCGGVVAGINSKMVPAEVAYLLGDYAPTVLVTDSAGRARVDEIGELSSRDGEPVASPTVMTVSDVTARRSGEPADVERQVDPDAVHMIVTTSGSTARPKGVMFSNHSMIDHVSAFVLEDPIQAQPVKSFVVAPFNTTAGGMQFLHVLIQGGTCHFSPEFDPAHTLEVIEKNRISMFAGAPIFFQRIADLPEFEAADVSCIEISCTGGAAVAPALLQRWADKGVIVRQMYSQTEAGGWGTTNPRRYALSDPDRCGYGGPTRDIRIVDADGNDVPAGEQGQIIMRGPGQMLGYWNDPEATARTVVDGWLHTGDIGELDDRGLLRFVDRMKDIIISGGLNISAAEVERTLTEHPDVEEAAVIAAPDDRFGETPMAIIYGPSAPSVEKVIEYCNTNLSSYKVPRYMVVSEGPLPRLATGKISKPVLRATYLEEQELPPRVR